MLARYRVLLWLGDCKKVVYFHGEQYGVSLTSANRRRCYTWFQEHKNETDQRWSRVLLTDENRNSLTSYSGRIHTWREHWTRNHPANIIERDLFGGGGFLVYVNIMLGSHTDFPIFQGSSISSACYCTEVLLPQVRLFGCTWVLSSFLWATTLYLIV